MKRVLMWALSLLATLVACRAVVGLFINAIHRVYLLLSLPLL